MASHYDHQILQQPSMRGGARVYGGPARQFGSGGGIGAFAMRMSPVAMPLVKKYVVPVAKELSKNLFTSIVPELVSSSASRKRPRTVLKESFKNSVNKTLTNMTASPDAGGRRTGRGERPGRSRGGGGRARGGGRTTGLRAAQVHANGSGSGRRGRVGGQAQSRAAANDVVISRQNTAKRSRSDILSAVNFDN